MTIARAGKLAVRAVNQYRKRDVVAYLALRYYLDGPIARNNHWVKNACIDHVLTRGSAPYFAAHNFKEKVGDQISHRIIYVPGPSEALAEAALLAACSEHIHFHPPAAVFSYRFAPMESREGIFSHYFQGYRDRHRGIAEACRQTPHGTVRHLDIRRFYPSVSVERAQSTWRHCSETAALSLVWTEVGEKLLEDYRGVSETGASLLTGPMFSHLVASLFLREIDESFAASDDVRYFRYVDDITLVGDASAVARVEQELRHRLSELGLECHQQDEVKCYSVATHDWLVGESDFDRDPLFLAWACLLGDLKQFLLQRAEERDALVAAFREEEIRLPVRDYSGLSQEFGYVRRFWQLARRPWFRRKVRQVTAGRLLADARSIRDRFAQRASTLMDDVIGAEGHYRRRMTPKLRFCAARLAYLLPSDDLARFAERASNVPELQPHAAVLHAVATGRVDSLLRMGVDVTQAAAQPLAAAGNTAIFDTPLTDEVERQAISVLLFNGVPVESQSHSNEMIEEHSLPRFARRGADLADMAPPPDHSSDCQQTFVRELACLHGLSEQPRHGTMFERVFDHDEALVLDTLDRLQQSGSG